MASALQFAQITLTVQTDFQASLQDASLQVKSGTAEHIFNQAAAMGGTAIFFGFRRIVFDQTDDFVDIGQGHRFTFGNMAFMTRFSGGCKGATGNDWVAQRILTNLFQVQQTRLAVSQGRMLIQKLSCSWVSLAELVPASAFSLRFNSITLHASLSDSSRRSDTPSAFFAHQFADFLNQLGCLLDMGFRSITMASRSPFCR